MSKQDVHTQQTLTTIKRQQLSEAILKYIDALGKIQAPY